MGSAGGFRRRRRLRGGWHAPDPHPLYPARIGVQNLELEAARMRNDLAPGWHPVDQGEDQPAQRVGLVAVLALQQRDAQLLLELLELYPAVGID